MNKAKRFVIDSHFIKQSLCNDLTLEEFLLLMYFDNAFDATFDIDMISDVTTLTHDKILEAYSKLLEKKFIKVETEKNGYGKLCEKVKLDGFYQNISKEEKALEKKKTKEDIFSIFEASFGRTLSGMDYEIINAWINNGYSEELIKAALNEAVYNGAVSLRYIDKVLFEWNKKGIKTANDVENRLKDDDLPLYETKILNFNWLDEDK